MTIQDVIQAVSTIDVYSHGVFGCFRHMGHYPQERKGPVDLFPYMVTEKDYMALFEKYSDGDVSTGGTEFLAKILVDKITEGTRYVLSFNDRQLDTRPGCHTDYHLLVPARLVHVLHPQFTENPDMLIKIFQNVFPKYDRSNGKLQIHPKFKMPR